MHSNYGKLFCMNCGCAISSDTLTVRFTCYVSWDWWTAVDRGGLTGQCVLILGVKSPLKWTTVPFFNTIEHTELQNRIKSSITVQFIVDELSM